MNQQIHMLRGDWLIEAITAIERGEAHWTPIPTNPTHLTPHNQGRFHMQTQTWWIDAGERSNTTPLQMHVYSPPEPRINYPGEHWTLTPTWVRNLHSELKANNTHKAWLQYAHTNTRTSIAYYSNTHRKVIWGKHSHALQKAALTASQHMPYYQDE